MPGAGLRQLSARGWSRRCARRWIPPRATSRARSRRSAELAPGAPLVHELREARILSQACQIRVRVQVVQLVVPELERPRQPGQGVLRVAETRVGAGGVVGRTRVLRAGLGGLERGADLILALAGDSLVAGRALEVRARGRVRGIELEQVLELADRVLILPLLAVEVRQVVARDRVLRIELDHLAVGGDGVVDPPLAVVSVGQVRLEEGRRRRRVDRLLQLDDRFLGLTFSQERGAAGILLGCRVGALLVGSLVLPVGDAHQKHAERQRDERCSHRTCSRQERTCFKKPGEGTGVFGSCWFVVAVMAEAVADPEPAGGFTMTTAIEAMPEPICVDFAAEWSVVVRAWPVLKFMAAKPVVICTA